MSTPETQPAAPAVPDQPQEVTVTLQIEGGKALLHVRTIWSGDTDTVIPVKLVPPWPTPTEIRKLPRALKDAIMATGAELAEEEYRTNKELTAFDAFAEEP